MKKRVFIGVAWPYVNGILHLGHLGGYLIPADICARFHRYRGRSVLMVSGSDCHGAPITVEAERRRLSPSAIVNLYHPRHRRVFRAYQISFDLYSKTTTANHRRVVQQLFLRLAKNGYIFKKKTRQYYSPQEKRFLPDRYVEGRCPYCGYEHARGDQCDHCGRILNEGELIHPRSKIGREKVVLRESEHYFLDLPKFVPFLKKYLQQRGQHWRRWVYRESEGWLKRGLSPRSISRDLDWGIPIPNDRLPPALRLTNAQHKRLYVWFEAVIGYLSASIAWGRYHHQDWRLFWQGKNLDHYYFMGKDNLVFHTLLWPAQLHGSYPRLHLPDYPAINHFLNFEGKQFSKSRGVIVDALAAAQQYGAAAMRFYLTFIAPENNDSSFSWSHFREVYQNVLINTFANFLYRSLKLAEGQSLMVNNNSSLITKLIRQSRQALERDCSPRSYLQSVLQIAQQGNRYLNREKPWQLEKGNPRRAQIMANSLAFVLALQLVSKPLIPDITNKLEKMTGVTFKHWPEKTAPLIKQALQQLKIQRPQPLFPKLTQATP